ncbi:CHAT domain-containing tetratricopeptide repeat protein [Micromonospora sediminicola]|uniref:CHAT domain-containing protein n=1 Tax=Micromonospora sediminicola TaxID=946078 RepID=UPI00340410E0
MVLSTEATAEASRLWEMAQEPENDAYLAEVTRTVGWFYWVRSLCSDNVKRDEDFQTSMRLFAILLHIGEEGWVPEGIPDLLRDDVAVDWVNEAVDLLRSPVGSRDFEQVSRAISLLRCAVMTQSHNSSVQAGRLRNLCAAFKLAFDLSGDASFLEEALEAGRKAVEVAPPADEHLFSHLGSLGNALERSFENSGLHSHLDEAVKVMRRAVEVAPTANDRARTLHSLANVLSTRFDRYGDASDLKHALRVRREACDVLGPDDPELPSLLNALGTTLRLKFQHHRDTADLDEAIETLYRAKAAMDPDDPELALTLHNLAHALQDLFRVVGDVTDLAQAIELLRQALASSNLTSIERAKMTSGLASCLADEFAISHDAAGLVEAVARVTAALEDLPEGHPVTLSLLRQLADVAYLQLQSVGADNPALSLGRVFEWLRRAAGVTTGSAVERVAAAVRWGTIAADHEHWADAADGFAAALSLMPDLIWRGLSRDVRDETLGQLGGLASEGAACAIAAKQPARALRMLEQGRSLLWSQALEGHFDVEHLRTIAPDLADRVVSLATRLDHPLMEPAESDRSGPDPSAAVDQRMSLAHQWDAVIREVRSLPQFRSSTPWSDDPRAAARGGTIAVINVSELRCDVIFIDDQQIRSEELPTLTFSDAVRHANDYWRALQLYHGRAQTEPFARMALEQAMLSALDWLWKAVAGPVLKLLGIDKDHEGPGPWPRVWWCPTPPLTGMPLHAAGAYRPNGSGENALDRVVSSYTTTVKSLLLPRDLKPSSRHSRMSIISLQETPDLPNLPGAGLEKELLEELFPKERRTTLDGPKADHAAVTRAFSENLWVHASCHGKQNLHDPGTGGLMPYDWRQAGPVGIRETVDAGRAGGEFVFLSACQTAIGALSDIGETIHLTAALQHAGWRHVVGTLWSIWDDSALTISRFFYPQVVTRGRLAPALTAEALHRAVKACRDLPGNKSCPSRWAHIIHIGP